MNQMLKAKYSWDIYKYNSSHIHLIECNKDVYKYMMLKDSL